MSRQRKQGLQRAAGTAGGKEEKGRNPERESLRPPAPLRAHD